MRFKIVIKLLKILVMLVKNHNNITEIHVILQHKLKKNMKNLSVIKKIDLKVA